MIDYKVGKSLKSSLDGELVSKYYEGDNNINIRVRLRKEDRKDFKSLEKIFIPISLEQLAYIPLSTIAHIETGEGTDKITRENQSDIVQVKADFDKNIISSYNDAKIIVDQALLKEKTNIKDRDIYDIKLVENERFKESFNQLLFMFLLSIVFIYMIIASLFESFVGPLILMVSVPLGTIGVATALYFTGLTINIMSGMGMIILSGIVIREAVILQEFMEEQVNEGKEIKVAVFESVKVRLRPILMSAITNILGLLPLALALGKGSEVQQPLAVSVIGGLFASSFLTLFLIPILYYLYKVKVKKY